MTILQSPNSLFATFSIASARAFRHTVAVGLFAGVGLAVVFIQPLNVLAEKKVAKAADPAAETAVSSSSAAPAMYECSCDVSYTWKPNPSLPEKQLDPRTGRMVDVPPPPAEPVTVHALRITEEGAEQAALKALLNQRKAPSEAKAMDKCRADHEQLNRCIQSALQQAQSTLIAVDFEARHMMIKSINQSCRDAGGKCLNATFEAPSCMEVKDSNPPPAGSSSSAAAAEPAKGGKEKKK